MDACCQAYLLGCQRLMQEWAFVAGATPVWVDHYATIEPDVERQKINTWSMLAAIHDTAELCYRIVEGEPCPWHDKPEWGIDGWKNYLAVMEYVAKDGR